MKKRIKVSVLCTYRCVGSKDETTLLTIIPTIGFIFRTNERRVVFNWLVWQLSFCFIKKEKPQDK